MKKFLVKAFFAIACCLGILSTAIAQTSNDGKQGYLSFPPSMAATPHNCPGSKHWVTLGTGIAHCVLDDFVCPMAQHLVHDAIGNPSCVSNTCPSNQVLQGDGVSCACPASLSVWNGSSCVAPPPPPPPTSSTYTFTAGDTIYDYGAKENRTGAGADGVVFANWIGSNPISPNGNYKGVKFAIYYQEAVPINSWTTIIRFFDIVPDNIFSSITLNGRTPASSGRNSANGLFFFDLGPSSITPGSTYTLTIQ